MEKIKINDMQTKGVVFIVKYGAISPEGGVYENREATLNVNFNKQEIWYLENEVGLGGTVSVEITNKPKNPDEPSAGYWINITKVDMKSAVKGEKIESPENQQIDARNAGLMSAKDISIISQCLTKCYGYGSQVSPQEVLDAYRFFVLELEQNG